MTTTPPNAEDRLGAALEEYQAGLDVGAPPDRRTLLARHAERVTGLASASTPRRGRPSTPPAD
jgi:hypothetical protein